MSESTAHRRFHRRRVRCYEFEYVVPWEQLINQWQERAER